MARTRPHVLLAAGGTGGHVFPALAVGDALVERGWSVSLSAPGRPLETRLAAERGFELWPLAARPVLGRGPLGQALAFATLARSALQARRLVRRLGTRTVVGTGGYAAAPALLGARLARVPVYLIEPNARAGLANRKLSRFAAEAAIAFEETRDELACPSRLTGVPVRAEFFDVAPLAPSGASASLDEASGGPLRLLVLGGSQGARQLNEIVPEALAELLASPAAPGERIAVTHQCGGAHVDATAAAYRGAGLGAHLIGAAGGGEETPSAADAAALSVRVTPFIDDVAAAFADSRLVVCRAGALTVAELCAAGRPAIFVPLAIAGGHQVDNARAVVEGGGARLLEPGAAEPSILAAQLGELFSHPERLTAMGQAARRLAHPDAAATIADRIEALAGIVPSAPGDGGAG